MRHQTKTRTVLDTAIAAALALAAVALTGCTSAGYQKGDTAASSMQTAAAEVQAESKSLELTMGALKELVNEPGELKQQYLHFSSSLERLIAAARRTDDTGRRMEMKSAAYFQVWNQQLAAMDYEHIRNLSQARETEVTNHFATVNHRYKESQNVVQPLISYIEDIRRALSTDLTPSGLKALKPVVTNADQNSAKVQTALATLAGALTDSSTRMSSIALKTGEDATP